MLHIWDRGVVFLLEKPKFLGKFPFNCRVPQFYIHVYAYIRGFYPIFHPVFQLFLE